MNSFILSYTSPSATGRVGTRVNPYFDKFMFNLLTLFAADRQILEDRGAFVIRQLCILMNSEDIYRSLSDILLQVWSCMKT